MSAEAKFKDSTAIEQLLSSIESGDRESEQVLVSQYWRSLLYILNRRSNDMDLAADIAQDTFLVVIKKARNGEIENPSAIAAFIRQTGINLLINHYRKETRQKTDFIEDIQIDIPDFQTEIPAKINKEQVQKIVKQLMDELPTQRDREILLRYFVYGESKAQICIEFELKKEHFDRVLYRARNRLKQIIKLKLNLDTSEISVKHLLLLGLLSLATPSQIQQNTANKTFFQFSVREHSSLTHLVNNSVMERRKQHLAPRQFERQVR